MGSIPQGGAIAFSLEKIKTKSENFHLFGWFDVQNLPVSNCKIDKINS
jgi:hypothetical protein